MREKTHPLVVAVLISMALAGGLLFVAGYLPYTVERLIPGMQWLGYLWAGVLAVSSLAATIGTAWRGKDPVDGWQWEVAGLPGVAGTCLAYAVAVTADMGSNWGALLAVIVFGSIGVGAGWRCKNVWQEFRKYRAVTLA